MATLSTWPPPVADGVGKEEGFELGLEKGVEQPTSSSFGFGKKYLGKE
jgi:hypothetical protein